MSASKKSLTDTSFWSAHWSDATVSRNPLGYEDRVWRQVYGQIFKDAPAGARCLEVGCGNSQHLVAIAGYGLQVAGIDFTENGCRLAKEWLTKAGVQGEIYQRDLFDANEDLAGQFDFVVSFGLVEHFDDPSEPLRAMRRLLRPGGHILTTTPNVDPHSLTVRVRRIIGPKILAAHKLMSLDEVKGFHERSGFQTLTCHLQGMGLSLACDEPTRTNRLVRYISYRTIQTIRKTLEVLRITPPAHRLTGLLMVYIGRV
jgi:2-polyprenyl-3-methyl-5-hydroxy-6-metoxy-1,4-benzoquinol methylase